MSDSDCSTHPNTPPSFSEDVSNQDTSHVFAWLKPTSPTACGAFDDTVNAVIKHPNAYTHMRQFLCTDPSRSTRATSVFTDDDDAPGNNSELDRKKPQWIGAFKFSLRTPPYVSGNGWSIGTGHGLPAGEEVDIMLAPPSKRWSTNIAGKHARLYFHKESGRMTLEARHTVKLSGMGGADVITKPASRVLEHGAFISIGDCLYTFEYTDFIKSDEFLGELAGFMKVHHGPGWTLHRMLSPTSGGDLISLGKYTYSPGAFAKGTFGEVGAGWARDGGTVAIKRFKAPNKDLLKAHQDMMSYIGEHV